MLAFFKRTGLSPSIAETAPVWLMLRLGDLAAVALWWTLALGLVKVDGPFERACSTPIL